MTRLVAAALALGLAAAAHAQTSALGNFDIGAIPTAFAQRACAPAHCNPIAPISTTSAWPRKPRIIRRPGVRRAAHGGRAGGYQPFTDGNDRVHFRARMIWSALPEQGINVQLRWRQYRSGKDDVDGAYFNPDGYERRPRLCVSAGRHHAHPSVLTGCTAFRRHWAWSCNTRRVPLGSEL